MPRRILLINGHPDPAENHFAQALAAAYAEGAAEGAHELREVRLARLDFPVLRSRREWEESPCPEVLQPAQQDLAWAQHIVMIYPLWLGDVPAHLKAFLEQVARPGFAFDSDARAMGPKGLKGKTATVVVTMGMPGLFYRWFYFAHSLRSLKRNVLSFVGIKTIGTEVIGSIETPRAQVRERWLQKMRERGRRGA